MFKTTVGRQEEVGSQGCKQHLCLRGWGVRDGEWSLGLLKLSVPFRTFWERIFWNSATLRIRATYGRASSRYCPWLLLLLPSEEPGGEAMARGMEAYCELPGWECPPIMSHTHSQQEFERRE